MAQDINSDARMTRGLSLFETKGKKIRENEDGSSVPSQTGDLFTRFAYSKQNSYALVPISFRDRYRILQAYSRGKILGSFSDFS